MVPIQLFRETHLNCMRWSAVMITVSKLFFLLLLLFTNVPISNRFFYMQILQQIRSHLRCSRERARYGCEIQTIWLNIQSWKISWIECVFVCVCESDEVGHCFWYQSEWWLMFVSSFFLASIPNYFTNFSFVLFYFFPSRFVCLFVFSSSSSSVCIV